MNVEQRIKIERKVVRHLIRAMKERGWVISRIFDGGEPDEDTISPNETEAIDAVFAVDESKIFFKKGDMNRSAYIVLGNDGWDAIADHSLSKPDLADDDFEKIMDEDVYPYCEKLEAG